MDLPPHPAIQANIKAPESRVIAQPSSGIHPAMVGIHNHPAVTIAISVMVKMAVAIKPSIMVKVVR